MIRSCGSSAMPSAVAVLEESGGAPWEGTTSSVSCAGGRAWGAAPLARRADHHCGIGILQGTVPWALARRELMTSKRGVGLRRLAILDLAVLSVPVGGRHPSVRRARR